MSVDYSDVENSDNAIDKALISSMEWENASTGETWDGKDLAKIYNEARMNLSVEAAAAGTLTVEVGGDVVATYKFDAAGQKIERTFIVDDDVELLWNAGSTTTESGNVKFVVKDDNEGVIEGLEGRIQANGQVMFQFDDPAGKYISTGKVTGVSYSWEITDANGVRMAQQDGYNKINKTTTTLSVAQSETVTVTISNVNATADKVTVNALTGRPDSTKSQPVNTDWVAAATFTAPSGFAAEIEADGHFANNTTVAAGDTVDYTITLTPTDGSDISDLTAAGVDITAISGDTKNNAETVKVEGNSIVITFTYTVA